jgi:ABC-type multidrug transport system fused ATPase/permease subunit
LFDKYSGSLSIFAQEYVNKLQERQIKIVAITNHNKFVREEYLVIKEKAEKKGILVLPGVEISISDGKSGLHLLCIFPEQLADIDRYENQCLIEKFITNMFPNRRFDDQGDPLKSDKNLKEMVNILEGLGIKYMIIPAHVDGNKRCFKEWSFSSIIPFINREWIRRKIMAFQDISHSSRQKYENEAHAIAKRMDIQDRLLIPAYIEASDPKCIDEVGRKFSFIKLGELSFEALYFALSQPELRLMKGMDQGEKVPCIKNISFLTQKGLKGVNIHFNTGLNNLVGIRGSGKSTIIEAVRYVFEIDADDDRDYKNGLMKDLTVLKIL